MSRTIKDTTIQRYEYEIHEQLRVHLQLLVDAYSHACKLKTLSGLAPYENILSARTKEPNRFRLDPSYYILEPYT